MDLQLFKDIVSKFYEYNHLPAFILSGGKLIFYTFDSAFIAPDAESFLSGLGQSGITVFGDIEYYASFPYSDGGNKYQVVIGPCFSVHPMTLGYRGKLGMGNIIAAGHVHDFILSVSLTGRENIIRYLSIISEMTGNGKFDKAAFPIGNTTLTAELGKRLTEFVFDTRENTLSPYAPETEKRILEMVKEGDAESVKKVNTAFAADAPGRSVSYLFKVVSLVAVCTRAVLDAGVDATTAYGLSDRYLEKLGEAQNNSQISDIARNILPHFALLVRENRGGANRKYSPHLVRAEKYVKAHLHYRITLRDVAEEIGVSEKYLSRLFITHKGEKFTAYVNRCRVNEAKELFLNTDYTLTEISYSLGFVSESYFIKVFGEMCGITPNAYRKKYKNNK